MKEKKSILYTGTGDRGTTGLVSGARLPKHHARIEAYGTVDELNSHLGAIACGMKKDSDEAQIISWMQNKLFDLGAYLADDRADAPQAITDGDIIKIQSAIDRIDADLPALNQFVLPGGSPQAAACHIARAVCRRGERRIVALAETEHVDPNAIVFVNRASDLLFAMARKANISAGADEIFWQKNC